MNYETFFRSFTLIYKRPGERIYLPSYDTCKNNRVKKDF